MNPDHCRAFVAALIVNAAMLVSAPASAADLAYAVQPGDILTVSVWKEPSLQSPVLVRPDGGFSFPLAGEIDAHGKSVADLQKLLTERLAKYISEPVVSVSVQEVKGNKIYVLGQVNKPGEFVVNPSVNAMQALSMAGGTNSFANNGGIFILRRGKGGTQIAIPFHYGDVLKGKSLEQNIDLQSGDIVVVP
jgi:polysaccharide export outer membrane protein